MVGKFKVMILFIAVISLTCLVLNFSGINAEACAQDTPACKTKECPLDKVAKCSSDTSCKKKSKYDKGGCHKIDDMLSLTRCAKKELLKEKIKANLEKKIGTKLMVIVNNDEQAIIKKGKPFMPCDERITIIKELKCVDYVIKSIDLDRTVCKTLLNMEIKPDYFCNGGDQNNNTIPEGEICEKRGIELRDGFGDKIQSSSWLIKGKK